MTKTTTKRARQVIGALGIYFMWYIMFTKLFDMSVLYGNEVIWLWLGTSTLNVIVILLLKQGTGIFDRLLTKETKWVK